MNQPKTFYEQQCDRIASEHGLPAYQYIQVRQSKEFMEKYHWQKIALAQMAAAACMSRFHYIRLFRQIYGVTPRHYLRDLRISKAKELLKKGFRVTQVCVDVGYESVPTFCRAFKKGTSYSPASYQQMHLSNRE